MASRPLRREEVALLAGISIEYYTRLERGAVGGVSEEALDALVRALQLDDVGRAHLVDLVRTANARPVRRHTRDQVRPSVQRLLDSMTGTAAFVRNGRLHILSANQFGYALYAPAFLDPARPVNLARFVFLDRRSKQFYGDWHGIARDAVGSLRAEAGRNPTTGPFPTWSASCPPAATSSPPAGPSTTSGTTGAAASPSTIPSSATPRLRRARNTGRPRTDDHRLERRPGLAVPPGPRTARQLGRHQPRHHRNPVLNATPARAAHRRRYLG